MTTVDADLDALCTALEGVARALQSASPDAVLAAEPSLATALSAFTRSRAARSVADPARLRRRVTEGRIALARCEALGRSAAGLHAAMFPSQMSYRRDGQLQCAPAVRRTLESRS